MEKYYIGKDYEDGEEVDLYVNEENYYREFFKMPQVDKLTI